MIEQREKPLRSSKLNNLVFHNLVSDTESFSRNNLSKSCFALNDFNT